MKIGSFKFSLRELSNLDRAALSLPPLTTFGLQELWRSMMLAGAAGKIEDSLTYSLIYLYKFIKIC